MAKPLEKNGTDAVDMGWRVRAREFTAGFEQSVSQFNVSPGVYRGLGPRAGITPLPGHEDQEPRAGTVCNGLAAAEGGTGVGMINRVSIYGIVPTMMTPYDGTYPKDKRQSYLAIVGVNNGGVEYVDAAFFGTFGTPYYKHSENISSGLLASTYLQDSPSLLRRHKLEQIQLDPGATAAAVKGYLTKSSKKYLPVTSIGVAGKRIPYHWMLAWNPTNTAGASAIPDLNLWTASPPSAHIYLGMPSEFISNPSPGEQNGRSIFIFALTSGAHLIGAWRSEINSSNIFPVENYGSATTYRNMVTSESDFDGDVTQTKICLINDPGAYHMSAYDAVLMAADRPLALITQDWLKATNGMMPQWVDLSDPQFAPRVLESLTSSAFWNPDALVQGGPNSGLLRKGVTYDVGVSYYCKRLNFESNVIFGASRMIETDDFNSLNPVLDLIGTGDTLYQKLLADKDHITSWEYSVLKPVSDIENPRQFHINDWEIRFYYRQQGTQEWLPGVFVDAAKFWFFDYYDLLSDPEMGIGAQPIAGLVGGRNGGFIDYSPLAKQRYNCCVVYRNRAFWFTDTSVYFSLKDNIFAYPANNIVNATDGMWRGGIVHIQKGETEQQSWLIMFGTKSTYAAKFTGNTAQASVRISESTVGQFAIDGSDFFVDHLCAATAYSHRAAVIADGTLYFWGPQGVYMHEGDGTPVEITKNHRPNILELVDPNRIDEVHAVYSKDSKEVTWFYPPIEAIDGYETCGLIMNTETLEFFNARWPGKIDASQNLTITNGTTKAGLSGERVVIFARDTDTNSKQRAYFMDSRNMSGDMCPGTSFVVKAFSSPSSGTRRFTFAAGFSPTALASVQVGQPVAVHQAKRYAGSAAPGAVDFIGAVIGKGDNYVDVALPEWLLWPESGALTFDEYFPIYFDLNAIEWLIESRYWCPYGLNTELQFQYLFSQWRLVEWPTVPGMGASYTLSWRTPIGGYEWALDVPRYIRENSDGNSQIYHPFFPGESQMLGQALKFRMSGRHLGSSYTLQYLQLEGVATGYEPLKNFQE